MAAKETIKIKGKLLVDRFNDPLPDADQPDWRETQATVVPRSAGDFEQRGEVIIAGFMVILPANDPIIDTDILEIRGQEHEIDGVVGRYGKKAKILYTMRAN